MKLSLGKIKTRVKEGITEVQSVQGIKKVALNFSIGASLGAIVDLILEGIIHNFVQPAIGVKPTKIWGFGIFPNHHAINPATGKDEYWIAVDDLCLIVITLALLMSKKLWLVLGFLTGWYFSSYMGLYQALGLPEPAEPPPYELPIVT